MSIRPFGDRLPVFGPDVFVDLDATVIGDVVLEDGASVWPGAVLRGDVERIVLGSHVSFQDASVVHCDPGFPTTIAADSLVAHGVIVHGATIGVRCLVGMGSILLNGCVIGEESIVAAGALVPGGRSFPPRSVLMGSPARVVREVTDEEVGQTLELRDRYVRRARRYLELGFGADLSAFRSTAG
jgi:gamma-carbonic anhydrase